VITSSEYPHLPSGHVEPLHENLYERKLRGVRSHRLFGDNTLSTLPVGFAQDTTCQRDFFIP
jgi:hypothetical protein